MTNGTFDPFSPSMRDELKREYNAKAERYLMLDKMLRAEMITKAEYDQQRKELDESYLKIERIDKEFHILS